MYITSVELENFKIHRELKITLSNVTAIVGKNAKGKTSILDAISYGLYGVTGDGATKKELLTNANAMPPGIKPPKNGKVTITFDNGFHIVRDLATSSILYDDKNTKITDKATEIEQWLNIPKDMFMTLIYGIQGKMSDAFIKFNASQKDFIDSLFSIDEYMDPINSRLDEAKKVLDYKYNDIINKKNNKANAENYVTETLQSYNCSTFEELQTKIDNLENQLKMFSNVENVAAMKQKRSALQGKYSMTISSNKSDEMSLKSYESSLDSSRTMLQESIANLKTVLQIEITEDTQVSDLRVTVSNLCNINNWYGQLELILNSITPENCLQVKDSAIQILNFIKQIDTCRTSYNDLITSFNNAKVQLQNGKSSIDMIKNRLNNYVNDAEKLVQEINSLDSELSKIGAEGEGSNIDVYKQLVSNIAILKSAFSSLKNYQSQISNIIYDENELNHIAQLRDKISQIKIIFDRNGFPQYLRNAYIKDVAAMMNDMLLNFGFDSLLPVTVTNTGEFLYRGVKTKSISGAQKICTSIIQKFIYGRILAPGMKLGLMILDEPTYGLDNSRVDYLKEFLNVLNKTLGLQLIIVTHKPEIIPEDSQVIEL